ncbi:hypothetical protein EJ08DRAFT_662420 [Tothia fuscella]|uniref:Uncharacterized protein n=1 Tax=Tothia fuscella TaxID=1048955 RepID=A0A9P4NNV6_9PEZI|nr:hypothetical protein EJ08DRAFT_662420 [Tothia fuscella]
MARIGHRLVLISFSLLFAIGTTTADNKTCTYPDSTEARDFNYTSCNPGPGYSACCFAGEGDICLPGGYCYFPPQPALHGNYIYRAACDDASWLDGNCPQRCVSNVPNKFETLRFCSDSSEWCCAKSGPGDCCGSPSLRFKLAGISDEIISNLRAGAANDTTAPTATFAPAGSSNTNNPSTSMPPPSPATSQTSSTTGSLHNEKKSGTLSAGAFGGIGAGAAAIAVLVLATSAFCLWRRHKRVKNMEQKSVSSGTSGDVEMRGEQAGQGEQTGAAAQRLQRDSVQIEQGTISPQISGELNSPQATGATVASPDHNAQSSMVVDGGDNARNTGVQELGQRELELLDSKEVEGHVYDGDSIKELPAGSVKSIGSPGPSHLPRIRTE